MKNNIYFRHVFLFLVLFTLGCQSDDIKRFEKATVLDVDKEHIKHDTSIPGKAMNECYT